jgi:hypothetical protein
MLPKQSCLRSRLLAINRKERLSDIPTPKPTETLQSLEEVALTPRRPYKKVHFAPEYDLTEVHLIPRTPSPDSQEDLSTKMPRTGPPPYQCVRGGPPRSILKTSLTRHTTLPLSPPTSRGSPPGDEIVVNSQDLNPAATRLVIRVHDTLTDLVCHFHSTAADITSTMIYLDGKKVDTFSLPDSVVSLLKSAKSLRGTMRIILERHQCHQLSLSVLLQFKVLADRMGQWFRPIDDMLVALRSKEGKKKLGCRVAGSLKWTASIKEEAGKIRGIVESFAAECETLKSGIENSLKSGKRGETESKVVSGRKDQKESTGGFIAGKRDERTYSSHSGESLWGHHPGSFSLMS